MVDLALCSHGEKGCSSFFLLTNKLYRVTATISNESLAELLRRLCVLSAMSKRCQNLLLQIYLHFPEIIQYVTLPEGTFSSGGAAHGTKCKVSRCTPAPSSTCPCAVKRVAADFFFFFLQTVVICAPILVHFFRLAAGRAGASPGHAARRHVRLQVCREPHF